jgi:parvulin-like peptidyl-prolyl isomerase
MLLATTVSMASERTVMEAIMIRVNDRIVTITDFHNRLLQELSQRPEPPEGEDLRRFASGLFDAVVDEMVILERADEKRVTIDDAAVDASIDALREENDLQDDEAFAAALSESGMDEEQLRERYRQQMVLRRTVQAEIKTVEITTQEVRDLYEAEKERFRVPKKIELVQLYFPVAEDEKDRNEVRRRALGLTERVSAGSDMAAEATLAGIEVQELGAIPEEDLRPELAEAVKNIEDGGMSAPLYTAGGFQVVRVIRRIPATYQDFDEVSEILRRRLSVERYQDQSQGLVNKLKQEFLVETNRDLLDKALIGIVDG